MRQYVYCSHQIGLDSWPAGELRLEGIEVTKEPDLADVFVVPGALSMFQVDGNLQMDRLYALPYLRGNESRTVFFDVSDNFKTPINLPIIFIRCDARDWMLPSDPGTIQFGWPVEDFAEVIPLPEGGFKYDISGHMWLSSETRKSSLAAIKNNRMLKSDLAGYSDFTGYIYHESEGIRRRAEFRRSMKESRISLCPESIPGVFPYRFFEAMSSGRVALLVGSDFVWPWEKDVPYESFSIVCPRNLADQADQVALTFLQSHSDDEIIQMGKQARIYWETYLRSSDWPRLHAIAIQRKLEEMKAAA